MCLSLGEKIAGVRDAVPWSFRPTSSARGGGCGLAGPSAMTRPLSRVLFPV
jgi:hypothetical protein